MVPPGRGGDILAGGRQREVVGPAPERELSAETGGRGSSYEVQRQHHYGDTTRTGPSPGNHGPPARAVRLGIGSGKTTGPVTALPYPCETAGGVRADLGHGACGASPMVPHLGRSQGRCWVCSGAERGARPGVRSAGTRVPHGGAVGGGSCRVDRADAANGRDRQRCGTGCFSEGTKTPRTKLPTVTPRDPLPLGATAPRSGCPPEMVNSKV